MLKWSRFFLGGFAVFLLIQWIPYGKDHSSPHVLRAPVWDSKETQAYFENSCADCHSNETRWPWYSHIAPVSWLIQRHVNEGRQKLNLSALGYQNNEIGEMAEAIWERHMPPRDYLLLHADAVRKEDDLQRFIRGLERTFANPQNTP